MDIYAKFGAKARFLDKNGYEFDRAKARRYMQKDDVLTIHTIRVYAWNSDVEFIEHPGVSFNTVMFADA